MSGYLWGVEHRRADGFVLSVTEYPTEDDARFRVEQCHHGGGPCVLVRRELGPWRPVVEAVA